MSTSEQKRIIDSLNLDVAQLYNDNRPLRITLDGTRRPNLYVSSFEPLAVTQYGRLTNRAPYIAGKYALRFLITATSPYGQVIPYLGLEANRSNVGHGCKMHAADLNNLAKALGRTDVTFYDT